MGMVCAQKRWRFAAAFQSMFQQDRTALLVGEVPRFICSVQWTSQITNFALEDFVIVLL